MSRNKIELQEKITVEVVKEEEDMMIKMEMIEEVEEAMEVEVVVAAAMAIEEIEIGEIDKIEETEVIEEVDEIMIGETTMTLAMVVATAEAGAEAMAVPAGTKALPTTTLTLNQKENPLIMIPTVVEILLILVINFQPHQLLPTHKIIELKGTTTLNPKKNNLMALHCPLTLLFI